MSLQAKIPLAGLLEGYEVALSEMGYSISTKLKYMSRAELVIRKHQTNGLDYLDQTIIDVYVKDLDDRLFNGMINRMYCERKKLEIARFVQYAYSGNGGALPSVLRGARQRLTPEFERIADDFLSGDFHPNTRCDMRLVTHKYFAWLEEHGFRNLSGVGAVQLQKFLLESSEQFAPSSIHNILLYIRKLYAFLHESGQSESDYKELLSLRVNREKKVYPALPKEDIARLLDAIDRSTVKGKRDYAIMLMGTVLGMRACDIVKLKLGDIDWLRGEIRILQSKTSNLVILPLTQDVGEALQDYILNARPKSDSEEIFLRIDAPHTKLAAAVTIGEIYRDCSIRAGLPVNERFHNLRRALGISMVSNGVSVYDVAQVVGDRNIESTTPYLAADTVHLKMCALPFDGIAPAGSDPR